MTAARGDLSELRRGVLEACVLALLEERPRFGLELVRELSKADGLLTSEGTIYPLLTRVHGNGLVSSHWEDVPGSRPRRCYELTDEGRDALAAFRISWDRFRRSVDDVLHRNQSGDHKAGAAQHPRRERRA